MSHSIFGAYRHMKKSSITEGTDLEGTDLEGASTHTEMIDYLESVAAGEIDQRQHAFYVARKALSFIDPSFALEEGIGSSVKRFAKGVNDAIQQSWEEPKPKAKPVTKKKKPRVTPKDIAKGMWD